MSVSEYANMRSQVLNEIDDNKRRKRSHTTIDSAKIGIAKSLNRKTPLTPTQLEALMSRSEYSGSVTQANGEYMC